jgi:hypothetical protein
MTTAYTGQGLVEALHVPQPDPELARELMLFGRFVGSWRIDWFGLDKDGAPAQAQGELHFGWVLGGRAVQDVWIMPGRHEPVPAQPLPAFHGTTIRFYDPSISAWRSIWINPISGRVRRFIGSRVDGDIVLISDEEDPWLRWRFTEITERSARWLGELSDDHGATWTLEEEMRLTRTSG